MEGYDQVFAGAAGIPIAPASVRRQGRSARLERIESELSRQRSRLPEEERLIDDLPRGPEDPTLEVFDDR